MYKPQNKTFYCRYRDSGSRDVTIINQVIIVCKDCRAKRSAILLYHSCTEKPRCHIHSGWYLILLISFLIIRRQTHTHMLEKSFMPEQG